MLNYPLMAQDTGGWSEEQSWDHMTATVLADTTLPLDESRASFLVTAQLPINPESVVPPSNPFYTLVMTSLHCSPGISSHSVKNLILK